MDYTITIEKPIILFNQKGEPINTFLRWFFTTEAQTVKEAILNLLPVLEKEKD